MRITFRLGALAAAAAGLLASPARAEGALAAGEGSLVEEWHLSTRIATESVVGLRRGSFQKLQLLVEPKLEVDFRSDVSLTASARLRYDAFDRLEPGRPSQPEVSNLSRTHGIGSHAEAELRELFVESDLGGVLLTIGKQQVVWGKADGLKVLDVVNPQDFREFIFAPFSDSRIPLWTANAEIPIGGASLQLLWIPDPSYYDLPTSDALFAFTSPQTFLPVDVRKRDRPDRFFADSDAGARLSGFYRGWDLTLNYLYHYSDIPEFERTLDASDPFARPSFEARYGRTHLAGFSFANSFGSLTVRGEVGYFFGKHFSRSSRADADGLGESDELSYVLGLDWYGFRETFLSVQVFQTWLPSREADFVPPELVTRMSLVARRSFRNETVTAEVQLIYDLHDGDGFVRPKVYWEIRDDLRGWLGFDVIFGSRRGVFGQFSDLDRFVVGLEWTL